MGEGEVSRCNQGRGRVSEGRERPRVEEGRGMELGGGGGSRSAWEMDRGGGYYDTWPPASPCISINPSIDFGAKIGEDVFEDTPNLPL